MALGDRVASINGETGVVVGFGGPNHSPWALVENEDGYRQSFGLHTLQVITNEDAA